MLSLDDLREYSSAVFKRASIVYNTFYFLVRPYSTSNACDKVVVITGCDSGFGMLVAQHLTAVGCRVIAACLTDDGVDTMSQCAAMAIKCDVTKDDDVKHLADAVQAYIDSTNNDNENLYTMAKEHAKNNLSLNLDSSSSSSGVAGFRKVKLWAVVNNAGVAPSGYVDWLPMHLCVKVMDVNYFGTLRIIKAMLPLLKRSRDSRIINISSAAGVSGMPHGGPYCASKHAVEGLAKCLRSELAPWNIHVCNINPGFMSTPLIGKSTEFGISEFEKAPVAIKKFYSLEKIQNTFKVIKASEENPDVVVRAITYNVFCRKPNLSNPVGLQSFFISMNGMMPLFLQSWTSAIYGGMLSCGPDKAMVDAMQTDE